MKLSNIWNKRETSTLFVLLLIFVVTSLAEEDFTARRFEYKHSFKGPYMVLSNGSIPFWEHYGSAIASDESVRITPSLRSKKGSIWSRESFRHENWLTEISFRVSGRGRVGADGLAVWFTTEKSEEGPVFGNKDRWNGLGLFFDSFDNDNKHNNPHVMAMLNDGTKEYDHEADGSSQQLEGCSKDFRNKPYPVKVKIEYIKKVLTVSISNGLSEEDDFDLCFKVENVILPQTGYFGVSAATGGLADDHDVLEFLTHSLHPQDLSIENKNKFMEEKQKMDNEYQEFLEKMNKAKEEYKKEHPKAVSDLDVNDILYERQEERELRQIFESQNEIKKDIKHVVTLLFEISQKLQQQTHPNNNVDNKNDIEQVMNAQTVFSGHINELKEHVNQLSNRISALSSQDVPKNERIIQAVHDKLKQEITGVNNHLAILHNQVLAAQNTSSGLTVTHLIVVLSLHFLGIIALFIYKARKEAAAKKLF